MNYFRWMFLSVCVVWLAACSTAAPRAPAPIEDRATGVRPTSLYEGKPGYYVVKQGDTVMQVSRNTGYKPADIVAWNNLSKPNELNVGQVLRVAPPGSDGAAMTASSASVETQSGAASSRSVEMTPLFPAGSTTTPSNATNATMAAQPGVMNKTAPLGNKQPYSENTLTAMQQQPGQAVTIAPAAQPMSKPASPQTTTSALSPNGAKVGTWNWPADGKMVSTFSDKKTKGIDIAGAMGQPVRAAADGKVTHVGPLRGYGNMVIVKHEDSLNSVYAHNKRILVKEGDVVKQGQQIAEMGNSDSDIVKLRFEIRQQGKPVDPTQYLPPR